MSDDPYAVLAEDYAFLEPDEHLSGALLLARFGALLDTLPPGARVLDCACGTGSDALAMARRGIDVRGCDASADMVAVARRRASAEGLDVPFEAVPWEGLVDRFGEGAFDALLCLGNAIGHTPDEDAMVAALTAMRTVLRPGGWLVLDTRDWEWLAAEGFPLLVDPQPVVRRGRRCVTVRAWRVPDRWEDPHRMDLVLVFDEGDQVRHSVHPLHFRPFRAHELAGRLRAAGLEPGPRQGEDPGWYWVRATRPAAQR